MSNNIGGSGNFFCTVTSKQRWWCHIHLGHLGLVNVRHRCEEKWVDYIFQFQNTCADASQSASEHFWGAKILRSMGISKSQKFNRRRLFLFLMFIKSPRFVLSSLKGKGPTQFMHIHHPFKTEYCDKLGGFRREQMHS